MTASPLISPPQSPRTESGMAPQPLLAAAQTRLETLLPRRGDLSCLTIAVSAGDYCASQIARAVEDCDAHLLNLNVTADVTPAGSAVVELRATAANPAALVRSLERYGYDVLSWSGPDNEPDGDQPPDDDRQRALEALRYINV